MISAATGVPCEAEFIEIPERWHPDPTPEGRNRPFTGETSARRVDALGSLAKVVRPDQSSTNRPQTNSASHVQPTRVPELKLWGDGPKRGKEIEDNTGVHKRQAVGPHTVEDSGRPAVDYRGPEGTVLVGVKSAEVMPVHGEDIAGMIGTVAAADAAAPEMTHVEALGSLANIRRPHETSNDMRQCDSSRNVKPRSNVGSQLWGDGLKQKQVHQSVAVDRMRKAGGQTPDA